MAFDDEKPVGAATVAARTGCDSGTVLLSHLAAWRKNWSNLIIV